MIFYFCDHTLYTQVEKQKNELLRELEDLKEKLEEEGGVKAAQVS